MIREAIAKVVGGQSLATEEAAQVMEELMSGEATPAQFAALATALRIKGETVDELVGLAQVMRAKALKVATSLPVVDTCGTGGDGSGTFNISTAAAFVVAGAGVPVAKHGNRAMSSGCGSADVLEALGAEITLSPEQVAHSLNEVGFGFMFAPAFHPAMRHVAQPRREIGIRTVFNFLGPLTNPASAQRQLLGVSDPKMIPLMAQALQRLGAQHCLLVHGEDGLDEITLSGSTMIYELKDGAVRSYTFSPEDVGLRRAARQALAGGDAANNARIIKRVLGGEKGPQRDVVALNAAAALYAADKVASLKEGLELADWSIRSGKAAQALERLVRLTPAKVGQGS
ncbi:MAG: anthranilate phosphoribosyltransferase [Chloroflexi bacterium]|nr:anthranilate phosphoribosyltransferase [Chloroflexota bacterium]